MGAAATYGITIRKLWVNPRRTIEPIDLVAELFATFGVLGLACLGGLLWCAARITYAAAPPRAADR